MEIDRESLSRIKELLKNNPRGMNVTEIAREIDMNRMSVAKYLEMLVIAGHIDVKSFGPSKVYFSSQRLPVSAMLSLSSDFILLLDDDLRVVNINDRFLEFINSQREEIVNKNIRYFSFFIKFDPNIQPFIKEALDGNESRVEAGYDGDDKEYNFHIKFIPMVFDDGKKGITILIEDITDRKLMERALRESEANLARAQHIAQIGSWAWDIEKKTLDSSDEVYRIFGRERDDKNNYVPFMDMVHPDDRESVNSAIHASLNDDKPYSVDFRIIRPDGQIRFAHCEGEVTYNGEGKPVKIFGTIQDMTRIKHAEEELKKAHDVLEIKVKERTLELNDANQSLKLEIAERKKAEEKSAFLASIVESSDNAIIGKTLDGIITSWNKSAELIYGYNEKEIVGRPVSVLVPPGMADDIPSILARIKNGERISHYETDRIRKDGKIVRVSLSVSPIKDTYGNIIGAATIASDIAKNR